MASPSGGVAASKIAEINIEFLKAEVPDALERTDEGAQQVVSIVKKTIKTFAQTSVEKAPVVLNAAIENTLGVAHNAYRYVADVETELAEMPDVMCNAGGVRQVFLSWLVNVRACVATLCP